VTVPATRYLYSRFGTRQIADLLQIVFSAELLAPSRQLWLVSPWVSDIPVLDNRANGFTTLVPQWSRTHVRLSSVLLHLADRGAVVHVATRADEPHNTDFLNRLKAAGAGARNLQMHAAAELHDKGILGDGFFLAGSMNFTYSGISINQEALHFSTDPAIIAHHQVIFRARWGSERD
jgi:phosphatidylserine/phosphatidylglycerophosphate/cardiolipin synthase-like enzyme